MQNEKYAPFLNDVNMLKTLCNFSLCIVSNSAVKSFEFDIMEIFLLRLKVGLENEAFLIVKINSDVFYSALEA
ncbi:hypothetical protein T07_5670 [Trichinella nelsoni]|uniref:Uncharacterized protein n=1 Tax=Trichinella nelsoni TaxID=6336 RepID=A0A0V0S9N1_9BILA|nr:hypothetical protein T07_5670 [Trichinella nelsoni]